MPTVTMRTVSGMTCQHCVNSVTEEVLAIANVGEVEVDLASGSVTITSDGELDESALSDAVDEAGYVLAP
jgi:copper chaperone